MLPKFFDWLSKLQPRQLLALSAGAAIFVFALMYLALTMMIDERMAMKTLTGEETQPVEIKMSPVVVATQDIEPRVMLSRNMLEIKEMPVESIPEGAVTEISAIVNLPTRANIFKGDIMTAQKVYRNLDQGGFVGAIPPDCRAVSVNVNDVTGVAGFAKAGDYVDVLLLEHDDEGATSSIILQNVLLLSINKNMGIYQNPKNVGNDVTNEAPVNPAAVAIDNPAIATLALVPDDVLRLVSASKLGEIYLTLRPLKPLDDYVQATEYTARSLKSQRLKEEQELKERQRQAAASSPPITQSVPANTQPTFIPPSVAEKPTPDNKKPEENKPRISVIYGDSFFDESKGK